VPDIQMFHYNDFALLTKLGILSRVQAVWLWPLFLAACLWASLRLVRIYRRRV
jgi:hypothetical protein